MEFSQKNDELPLEACSLTYFQSKSITNLRESEFWRKKKNQNKNLGKNAISEAETMEFGQKTNNLRWNPAHSPISNPKAAQIYVILNSGAKKDVLQNKNFLKNAISEAKTVEFGRKTIKPFMQSCSFMHFQSKSSTNKRSIKMKISRKKKSHFKGRNNEPPMESYLLAHFQSESCTNLSDFEFQRKKKGTKTKIFEKMLFRRPKRWNLAKNDEPLLEFYSLTHFQSKKLHKFA